MSNLAVAPKDEIRRLARKEIKQETSSTAQAVVRYRREIARLKRQFQELQKKISTLEAQERKRGASAKPAQEMIEGARFSARSVKAQRRNTGLSAADYACLVGVSPPTSYNWEQEKSRPRKEQLASLVAVRGLGKREAQAKLELLKNGAATSSSKRWRARRK
jgi:DNA-binding transcriptional regulator YiaG